MKIFGKTFGWALAIGLAGLLMSASARAGCSVSAARPASFGTVTSFVVANQSQSTSTSNSGLTCSGSLLSLLQFGDQIDATITSANGGRLGSATGDTIPYTIFADSNYSIVLNTGQTYNWFSSQLLNLLGIFGGPAASLPLYFRTSTGSNVAAGVYTDTLTVNWDWNYCAGIGVLGICLGRDQGSGVSTFQITAVVTNDCTITAPNVSFGSAPTVSGFQPVSGNIALTCTKGMSYTVGLSPGSNAAANGRRQMASGANRLQYDLFGNGGATVWGQASNRVASSGPADGISVNQFPYVAKIYNDQATPPVGTYTDSVIIDVRY
ncbi:spore coat U domain-containing protein [Burkholderia sp. Ac-20353]|uniref:Csu type fimbrial protein n=1 Tax=Burkholderia sp. Ac-20353 TaxID=2703894 RepID=UPI00197C9323|nr:spore coat U domain-containing protein [Burkholderia sp. Ac-20353]MBN3787161.1 spore coat protein U domain-containing protein [Burkholderia sp. Ac-20353]